MQLQSKMRCQDFWSHCICITTAIASRPKSVFEEATTHGHCNRDHMQLELQLKILSKPNRKNSNHRTKNPTLTNPKSRTAS